MLRNKVPVVEYLYVSTGKMEAMDVGRRFIRTGQATASIEFGPVALQVGMQPGGEWSDDLRRLGVLRKSLLRDAKDYDDPDAEVGGWVRFEEEMRWATMHPDQKREGEDRVAVFTTCYPRSLDFTDLILLGSTCHLKEETGSVGRMGSTSDTLFRLVEDPGLVRLSCVRLRRSEAQAALWLARILADDAPRWQKGRVEGLAKVMHVMPEGQHAMRFVVATPLYVRVCEPSSMKSRRSATQRRRRREKHGLEFVPGHR